MRLIAIALLLSACIEEHHGPGVVGSSDDMTTPPGDYAGYRVVTTCGGTWTDVGVIGTGSVAVTDTAAISAAGQDLKLQLADVASIWGWGGYGLVCEPGVGTQVHLSDWRDVDAVIARTGTWLHERDYALQVGISVGGVPVPHSAN
jgi:hypothetical protein